MPLLTVPRSLARSGRAVRLARVGMVGPLLNLNLDSGKIGRKISKPVRASASVALGAD